MGIFTKTDNRGNVQPRLGAIFAAAAAGLVGTTLFVKSFYINEARQTSLEVLFGRVVQEETTPGFKWKNPLASRYPYSLARQSTDVTEATNLRTGDDLRLSGRYHVDYEIDEKAQIAKLYFDLKDRGGDLDHVVTVRAKDAAVRAIEALSIEDLMPDEGSEKAGQSFTELITEGIKTRLQDGLSHEGWPVRIIGVYSDGFHFSSDSERRIEEIVGIRAERVKLHLREQNAVKAAEVFAKEAEADAAYLKTLIEAGLPQEDLATALWLKMTRDANRVNEPFAAGFGGGGNKISVAVPLPESVQRPQAPAPAPSPAP